MRPGEDKWFVAQTNMDVWKQDVTDKRYNEAIEALNGVGDRSQETLIDQVLDLPGVQTSLTIFAAGMDPTKMSVDIYKSPI